MQNEELTQERQKVRNLLEKDYEGIEDYLVENIDSLNEFLKIRKRKKAKVETKIKEEIVEDKLDKIIAEFLRNVGIPLKGKGYKYTKDAIRMYVEKDEVDIISVTKYVYTEIAKKYNVSISSVEKAIERVIPKNVNISKLNEYGYSIKGTIINSEFFVIAAEIIKESGEISKEKTQKKEYAPKIKAMIVPGEISIDKEINNCLRMLSIPVYVRGYKYLQEATKMYYIAKGDILIKKDLYVPIAVKFNTTDSRVERGIRYAIELGFAKSDSEIIYKIFGNRYFQEKGKATNLEFIATICEYIRLNTNAF